MRHVNVYIIDKTRKVIDFNYSGSQSIAKWAQDRLDYFQRSTHYDAYGFQKPFSIFRSEKKYHTSDEVKPEDD